MFAQLLFRHLRHIRHGHVTIRQGDQTYQFGDATADLRVIVDVHQARFYRRAVFGGGLGAADAWIDGDWTCDDLTALIRIFARQCDILDPLDRSWASVRAGVARFAHRLRANTRSQARKNIQQHYDLSNEFFALMLDPTMAYSCGIYTGPDSSLEDASVAKFDLACRKLDLQASDHLLEIGTGWGGFAIHAANHYGCRITTTTISECQYREAVRRIGDAGLSDRITVVQRDYRELTGTFDKLVSIEMIEAVGYEYLDTFFRQCDRLLKPDGMMMLQAIVIRDQRYRAYLKSVDFIRSHVFPGGCLPCTSELLNSMGRASELRLLQLEDFAPHYARTLRDWRHRFAANCSAVASLGFDLQFQRLWEYYLCYCEAAFEERHVNLVQMLFAKPGCRFDIYNWETRTNELAMLLPLEGQL